MSEQVADAKAEWVARVFGIKVDGGEARPRAAEATAPGERPALEDRADLQGAVAIGRARLQWLKAQAQALAEIQQLGEKSAAFMENIALGGEFLAEYQTFVAPVRQTLSVDLSDVLDDVRSQPAAGARSKMALRALAQVLDLRKFVSSDARLASLEQNPAVPVTLKQPLLDALGALADALRPT